MSIPRDGICILILTNIHYIMNFVHDRHSPFGMSMQACSPSLTLIISYYFFSSQYNSSLPIVLEVNGVPSAAL